MCYLTKYQSWMGSSPWNIKSDKTQALCKIPAFFHGQDLASHPSWWILTEPFRNRACRSWCTTKSPLLLELRSCDWQTPHKVGKKTWLWPLTMCVYPDVGMEAAGGGIWFTWRLIYTILSYSIFPLSPWLSIVFCISWLQHLTTFFLESRSNSIKKKLQ